MACNNCIRCEVCNRKWVEDNGIMKMRDVQECKYFIDRSKIIIPPCKVGDTYYYVQQQCTERGWHQNFVDTGLSDCEYCDTTGICDKRYIIKEKKFNTLTQIVEYYEKYILSHKLDKYRKIFHIKEEAEQARKELNKNE